MSPEEHIHTLGVSKLGITQVNVDLVITGFDERRQDVSKSSRRGGVEFATHSAHGANAVTRSIQLHGPDLADLFVLLMSQTGEIIATDQSV